MTGANAQRGTKSLVVAVLSLKSTILVAKLKPVVLE